MSNSESRFITGNWMVSGEKTSEISKRGYSLLRVEHGFYSGHGIGSILYSNYILGKSINKIKLENKSIPLQIIKSILAGTFSPEAFNIFMELAEHEPEQLDKLFKGGSR